MSVHQRALDAGYSCKEACLLSSLTENYDEHYIPIPASTLHYRALIGSSEIASVQFIVDAMTLFKDSSLVSQRDFAVELWQVGYRTVEELEADFDALIHYTGFWGFQAIYELSHPSDGLRALQYCFANPGLGLTDFRDAVAPAVERYRGNWLRIIASRLHVGGELAGDLREFHAKVAYTYPDVGVRVPTGDDADAIMQVLYDYQYPLTSVSPLITMENVRKFVQFHSAAQPSKTEPVVHERLIELFQLDMPFPMIRRIARPVMLHPWESTQTLADLLGSGVPASQVNRYLALQQFMGEEKLTAAHVRALVGAGQLNPALILTQGRGDGHVNVDAHEREWLSLDKYVAAL